MSRFWLAEYKYFTKHIVCKDNDHIREQFHHFVIDMQGTHTHAHTAQVQNKGHSPATEKADHFPENRPKALRTHFRLVT